jgi:hypothetical protein
VLLVGKNRNTGLKVIEIYSGIHLINFIHVVIIQI